MTDKPKIQDVDTAVALRENKEANSDSRTAILVGALFLIVTATVFLSDSTLLSSVPILPR